MSPQTGLTCPKCREAMTSYERGGVIVDQCTGCRGIFLDRGELERLLDLEGAPAAPAPPRDPGPPPDRAWRDREPERREWRDDEYEHKYKKKKSKRSMLGDLLDF
ncbi:MAG: zf-TFIIB domain-containing protein [Thermoleophilia bacterium]|nr:zf-TFIIB domain-containing protein [Thermoleophilia bacterium]